MANCSNCGSELPEGAQFCPKCGAAVSLGTLSNAPSSQPSFVLAFWGERFVAWLIDVAIFGFISLFIGLFTVLSGFSIFSGLSIFPSWLNWIPFVNFGFSGWIIFIYWTITDGLYGQSFGKMVMRIKVVRSDGRHPGLGFGVVESFGKAFLLPLDLLIGWLLHPRRRQRIFNYLSNTIVVKA